MVYAMSFFVIWCATMASISYFSAQYAAWKKHEERAKTYLGNAFSWSILMVLGIIAIGVWGRS